MLSRLVPSIVTGPVPLLTTPEIATPISATLLPLMRVSPSPLNATLLLLVEKLMPTPRVERPSILREPLLFIVS